MDYKRIYDSLITRALQRKVSSNMYYEKHHIVPKSIGGTDDEANIANLTLREHYIAHKLLALVYPTSSELTCALWIMTTTTMASLVKNKGCATNKQYKRLYRNMRKESIETKITSRDYDMAKGLFTKMRRGKICSVAERQNISDGTKRAMQNRTVIEKCISGSKGCKFYHSKKHPNEIHKWFPNDPPIDLNIYEWGRYKMSDKQKKKISESNRMAKKYFIIPETQTKYTQYLDYVKEIPNNWEEKWTNESNKLLRKYIISAVREFDILTEFKYSNTIIFRVPNKSKNFKIITPSLFVVCGKVLSDWKKHNIVQELVTSLLSNIEEIKKLNDKFLKKDVLI